MSMLDNVVSFLVTIITVAVATTGLMNVGAWLWVHRGQAAPWNWRVLVWPDVYYRWLDRL